MSELTIKDLKQDKRNYRKHNKSNLDLIKKSIAKVGFGRSVVIDNNNEIIAGNGLVSQVDKNTKIKVVETDGSELVVVKRTDLSTEDEKRKEMAVMDNSTSDTSEFDLEKLKNAFSPEKLNEMGIDTISVSSNGNPYTSKIDIPQYEVKGDIIEVKELYDNKKCKELQEEIENSNVSEEEKKFLLFACSRHIVFNYHNIAEYYASASKEMQELMEKNALVIVDYDNALRNGYTELNRKMLDLLEAEDD